MMKYLINAASKGRTDFLQAMINVGQATPQYALDVNAKQPDGSTALMLAAQNGHTGTVKLLLEVVADPNAKAETQNGGFPMNHKAVAQCSNGHTFEWGACRGEKKKLFGGTKVCGARGFEQVYADGSRLTVSFDDRPFDSIWCGSCKTEFTSTPCPQCGVKVPVSAFRKKGLLAKLG